MCDLYRHFDGDGQLLYVGISLSTIQRIGSHRAASRWYHLVRTVTIEKHPSKAEAMTAERRAIRVEKPLYNIAGADRATPIVIPCLEASGAPVDRDVAVFGSGLTGLLNADSEVGMPVLMKLAELMEKNAQGGQESPNDQTPLKLV